MTDPEREAELRQLLADQRGPYYYGDFRDGAVLLLRLLDEARAEIIYLSSFKESGDFWMQAQAETAAERDKARAAAIEEAAQWHDREAERIGKLANKPRNACNQTKMYEAVSEHENCAISIRALALALPQSEGGEG